MLRFYEWQLQFWLERSQTSGVSLDEGRILNQTSAFCANTLAPQSGAAFFFFFCTAQSDPLSDYSLFNHPTLPVQLNTQELLHHY